MIEGCTPVAAPVDPVDSADPAELESPAPVSASDVTTRQEATTATGVAFRPRARKVLRRIKLRAANAAAAAIATVVQVCVFMPR